MTHEDADKARAAWEDAIDARESVLDAFIPVGSTIDHNYNVIICVTPAQARELADKIAFADLARDDS